MLVTSEYIEQASEAEILEYIIGKLRIFKQFVITRDGVWSNPERALGWAEQFLEAVDKVRHRVRLSDALIGEIGRVRIFAEYLRNELKERM